MDFRITNSSVGMIDSLEVEGSAKDLLPSFQNSQLVVSIFSGVIVAKEDRSGAGTSNRAVLREMLWCDGAAGLRTLVGGITHDFNSSRAE